MKRRLVAVALTSFTLLATGVMTFAPAAQAGAVPPPTCYIDGPAHMSVTMGLSPITRTITPKTHGCTVADWYIAGDLFLAYADGGERQVFDPSWYSNGNAGPGNITVTVYNSNFDEFERVFGGFEALRRTTWQSGTFNASPEPVRKGKAITVKGRLLLANWDTMKYAGYANRSVALEFRTTSGSYSRVKYVKTSSTGWVNTTVTANKTGAWRLRYGGNTIASSATTAGDSVTVN